MMSNPDLAEHVTVYSTHRGEVTKISKRVGQIIRKNEKFLFLKTSGDGSVAINIDNNTSCIGTVHSLLVNVNDHVDVGTALMTITPCRHPALFNNICVSCGTNSSSIHASAAPSLDSSGNAFGDSGAGVGVGADVRHRNTHAGHGRHHHQHGHATTAYHMKSSQGLLKLSQHEADKVASEKYRALVEGKKLALVLDIDHTIAHCIEWNVGAARAHSEEGQIGHVDTETKTGVEEEADTVKGTTDTGSGSIASREDKEKCNLDKLSLTPAFESKAHVLQLGQDGPTPATATGAGAAPAPHSRYLVKFRPYLVDFLRGVSEYYQLTLYTNGNRRYAEAIAELIDPNNKLFARRIVARTDMQAVSRPGHQLSAFAASDNNHTIDYSNFDNPTFSSATNIHQGVYDGNKSLSLLFLNATSLVVIVDDRDDVWSSSSSSGSNSHTNYNNTIGMSNSRSKINAAASTTVTSAPGSASTSAVDQLLLIEPYVFFKDGVEAYNRTGNNAGTGAGVSANKEGNSGNSNKIVAGVGVGTSNTNTTTTTKNSYAAPPAPAAAPLPPSLRVIETDSILQRYLDVLKHLHHATYGKVGRNDSYYNCDIQTIQIQTAAATAATEHIITAPAVTSVPSSVTDHLSVVPTLMALKHEVLRGCHLQFQGFWHKSTGSGEIRNNKYVQLALKLGATVEGVDDGGVDAEPLTTSQTHLLTHVISKCVDADFTLWAYYRSHYRVHGHEHEQQDQDQEQEQEQEQYQEQKKKNEAKTNVAYVATAPEKNETTSITKSSENASETQVQASLPMLYIVTVDWLMKSVFYLQRADESRYQKYRVGSNTSGGVGGLSTVGPVRLPSIVPVQLIGGSDAASSTTTTSGGDASAAADVVDAAAADAVGGRKRGFVDSFQPISDSSRKMRSHSTSSASLSSHSSDGYDSTASSSDDEGFNEWCSGL